MNLSEMLFIHFGHFFLDCGEFFEKRCNLVFVIAFKMRKKKMFVSLCVETLVISIEHLGILILLR